MSSIVTDSMRLKQLFNQKMDLSYKIDEIVQTKSSLLSAGDDLMPVGTDYDPNSPVMKTLQARQQRAKILSQQLEQKEHEYRRQLQAVEAEYNSLDARINDTISKELKH